VILLVCDTNVLLDMLSGNIVSEMFRLRYRYITPDLVLRGELRETQISAVLGMGLQCLPVQHETANRAAVLGRAYPKLQDYDLLILATAESERCSLLTGDAALRGAAEDMHIEVVGTLWLIKQMMLSDLLSVASARSALQKMKQMGRRLPWDLAGQMLDECGR